MKKKILKISTSVMMIIILSTPINFARADFWGGDLSLLAEIVSNTLQTLYQLRDIMGNGVDTLQFMRDINSGIRDAMGIMQTFNTTIHPGVMGELQGPDA